MTRETSDRRYLTRLVLAVLVALALVAVIYSLSTANDGLDCATENAQRAQGSSLLDCG